MQPIERVIRVTTDRESDDDRRSLAYWLSRTPAERVRHVEDLRRQWSRSLGFDGSPPRRRELLESFNSRKVEYVVVGGYAVAHHGAPRFTGDIDLLVRPTQENAARVLDALAAFGFGSLDITTADLTEPGRVIQLGNSPWRIDLLTRLAGTTWEEVWTHAVDGAFEVPTKVIGLQQLKSNKRALGRPRDLDDLARLGG